MNNPIKIIDPFKYILPNADGSVRDIDLEGCYVLESNGSVKCGYMDKSGNWTDKATHEFKALWVNAVCNELDIKNKWKWANERWGIEDLRKYYTKALENARGGEFIKAINQLIPKDCQNSVEW